MDLQVLMATMHAKDISVVKNSNLTCQTVLVNQCDCEEESVQKIENVLKIDSPERGLSRSRNLAIKHATASVAIISDDDEEFIPNLEELVLKAYQELPEADIIVFDVHGRDRKFGDSPKRLKKLDTLKVCSVRLSFRLDKVQNKIWFDTRLGAGTGNGAGEENKFLFDALKLGLKIYHYPLYIATLKEGDSSWFKGYDEKYFYNRGMTTRYIMGWFLSTAYAFYYAVAKRNLHKGQMSVMGCIKHTLRGIRENKLGKEAKK